MRVKPMLINRRGVLGGLASMLAAPAIVNAGNLMPVRPILRPEIVIDTVTWTAVSGEKFTLSFVVEDMNQEDIVGFLTGHKCSLYESTRREFQFDECGYLITDTSKNEGLDVVYPSVPGKSRLVSGD